MDSHAIPSLSPHTHSVHWCKFLDIFPFLLRWWLWENWSSLCNIKETKQALFLCTLCLSKPILPPVSNVCRAIFLIRDRFHLVLDCRSGPILSRWSYSIQLTTPSVPYRQSVWDGYLPRFLISIWGSIWGRWAYGANIILYFALWNIWLHLVCTHTHLGLVHFWETVMYNPTAVMSVYENACRLYILPILKTCFMRFFFLVIFYLN